MVGVIFSQRYDTEYISSPLHSSFPAEMLIFWVESFNPGNPPKCLAPLHQDIALPLSMFPDLRSPLFTITSFPLNQLLETGYTCQLTSLNIVPEVVKLS